MVRSAVDTGFGKAFTTIMDTHVTTIVSAVFLMVFGTGPIRGFAIVLLIGIATSVFTAVTFTRMLVVLWIRRNRPTDINI